MKERSFMHRSVAVLALALAAAALAHAEETVRAARLSYLQGAVTVENIDNTGSEAAQLNLPLLAGTRLSTGDNGQAEVEFEDGSVVRLTPNTSLSLDHLDLHGESFVTNLSLLHGLAYVELRAASKYRYTFDAGGAIFSPVENATVRVEFDEPPATVAVLDGVIHLSKYAQANVGFQTNVKAGESLRADPADPARYFLTQEIAQASWDQWNVDRDQSAALYGRLRTTARDNNAGAQGYGWSDLDANGSWYDVPGQGEVWQPSLAVADDEFDPYGSGAWAWYPGTGYVWASAYAWGWTPYRCGSWNYWNGFGWGWIPGQGCGGFGWGFAGGGYPVNIRVGPPGYPIRRHPFPGSGHPVLPIRPPNGPWRPRPALTASDRAEPRRVDGIALKPLPAIAANGLRSGTALDRDYPVDRATHSPVVGAASTQPKVQMTPLGWRPAGTAAYSGASAYRGTGGTPATTYRPAPGPSHPASAPSHPAYSPSVSHPSYSPPAPAVHSAPAPAPAPAHK